jgi:hypothetical protein
MKVNSLMIQKMGLVGFIFQMAKYLKALLGRMLFGDREYCIEEMEAKLMDCGVRTN